MNKFSGKSDYETVYQLTGNIKFHNASNIFRNE